MKTLSSSSKEHAHIDPRQENDIILERVTANNVVPTKVLYEVNIDFDEASEAWKANKRGIGEGSYRYICAKRGKHNNECIAKCLPGLDYCRTHYRMFLDGKM